MYRLTVVGEPEPSRAAAVEQEIADAFHAFLDAVKAIPGNGVSLAQMEAHHGFNRWVGEDTTLAESVAPAAAPVALTFKTASSAEVPNG